MRNFNLNKNANSHAVRDNALKQGNILLANIIWRAWDKIETMDPKCEADDLTIGEIEDILGMKF